MLISAHSRLFICKTIILSVYISFKLYLQRSNYFNPFAIMKKIFFTILILLILAFSVIQFIIPSRIRITGSNNIELAPLSLQRGITNADNWGQWFPGELKSGSYSTEEITVTPLQKNVSSIKIKVLVKETSFTGSIGNLSSENEEKLFYSVEADEESTGPVSRIDQYLKAKKVKQHLETILEKMETFLTDNKNIYGFPLQMGKVKDSTLISAKITTSGYPKTAEIYGLIDDLHQYIAQHNGIIRDSAMLNIFPLQENNHQVMVAIPLERDIPSTEKFTIKKMVLGNLLQTEVKGGPYTIQKGEQALQNFINDYRRESPAIPFQSLITDRRKVTDTSLWITRLSYPVF